ncbi:hypothetical protein O181_010246 [Austropuccinia psidii MF-1]|uniref:Uncharacterized protein n=1 Tax=Austropuccinia psidii MF-1 TaxID=1389203 RepID=A0A9Q3GK81_9BASI|nr:hypothetical protein [Austropuccinia psidii MF-1]
MEYIQPTNTETNQSPAPQASQIDTFLSQLMQTQEALLATINNLQNDVNKLKVATNTPKKAPPVETSKMTCKKTHHNLKGTQRERAEPPPSISTHKKKKEIAQLPKSSPIREVTAPTVRHSPLQLISPDFPPAFKGVKASLFAHIKALWGICEKHTIPKPPPEEALIQFYQRFSDEADITKAVQDSSSLKLVNNQDVITLAKDKLRKRNLARGISHLSDSYISYICGTLSLLGITVWSPNLAQTSDNLYNVACRIAALVTFQQVTVGGAYNYMSINPKYIMEMSLLQKAYDHFVHYLMKARAEKEEKANGAYKNGCIKGLANKNRARLRDARLDYAIVNKFPTRYRQIIEDIGAHSDDEKDGDKKRYLIKTLRYRSCKANIFFCRLDWAMAESERASGTVSRRRERCLPKVPIASKNTQPPKGLPLDFYSIKWFKSLDQNQRRNIPNIHKVAFLPNPEESLLPKRNDNEKIPDKNFTRKYYDIISDDYNIEEMSESNDECSEESNGESIDLKGTSPDVSEEESDGVYEPGEYDYSDEEDKVNESSLGEGEDNNEDKMDGVED